MKKDQIEVGGLYTAKVSDKVVPVRIDSTHSRSGWNATNTTTGKRIHIKSAQRLRRVVRERGSDAGKAAAAAEDQQDEKADTKPTAKSGGTQQRVVNVAKPPREPKPKRVSALDAAATVLQKAGAPMRATELVVAMAEQGLWSSPGGKTPHATLYAAIIREIGVKKAESRFRKIERGQFAFNG